MYTIAQNAQIVITLLKRHNIKHIVISPGATNIPITQGVQNDSFFTCYSVVDERSALYFAIGLYLELGVPIATSCTSAQATRNYIPGLTEAFYKHVPILAITASKHPRFTYQDYMQAPDQTSLPVDAVKQSYALPYISNNHDRIHCERLVNEAILELTHRAPGPIQLNVPMVDNELKEFAETELPSVKMIKRYMVWDAWETPLKEKSIMIVIGEHRPLSKQQITALESFTERYNCVVYVNHLSNYQGKYTISGNLSLASMSQDIFSKNYRPDVLLTIGGQTGDYPLYWKLSAGNRFDFEHWRINEDGKLVDTYDKLTKIFECPFELFFDRLSKTARTSTTQHTYYKQWKELQDKMSISEELPLSNAFLAQQLHKSIPKKSYVNFAILNSLRTWSYFPLDSSIVCHSNVAAFGIDGCMSVLLGQSVVSDKLCFLVIGDLAFFYDMNSLGIRHLKNNIRILLVNNGCGAEFKLSAMKIDTDSYIAAAGHYGSAKAWAESNGFKYMQASTKDEFLSQKDLFTKEGDMPIVFEVFTNAENESKAGTLMFEKNRKENNAKALIRSAIGNQGISRIKRIINKK